MKVVTAAAILILGLGIWFFRDSLNRIADPVAKGKGVVIYDRLRAAPGYNVISYDRFNSSFWCMVTKLNGEVVVEIPGWLCRFTKQGEIYSLYRGISRRTSSGKTLWNRTLSPHHDLVLSPDGSEVFTWTTEVIQTKELGRVKTNVLKGFRASDGGDTFSWALTGHWDDYDKLLRERPGRAYWNEYTSEWEYGHFNSIQVLPENKWSASHPEFSAGNLLVGDAACSCLFVIERPSGKIVWSYTPGYPTEDSLHSPRLLENGNILFFHNNYSKRVKTERSRLIEIDPWSKAEVWSYEASLPGRFYAQFTGSAFPLPNGNIMVTHLMNGGSAFEVTRDHRVVWQFNNGQNLPLIEGEIYRIDRVSADDLAEVLLSHKNSGSAPFPL